MLHSVGERVHGTQPEQESLQEVDRCRRRWKKVEDRWERWRNDKRCEEGRQQQIKSDRKDRQDRETERAVKQKKGRASGADKGPQLKEAEGTPNFTWRRKEQHVFKCLISIHSWLCECQVSGHLPIQLRYRNHQVKQGSCLCPEKHTSKH